jgi:hypothetical protein
VSEVGTVDAFDHVYFSYYFRSASITHFDKF